MTNAWRHPDRCQVLKCACGYYSGHDYGEKCENCGKKKEPTRDED